LTAAVAGAAAAAAAAVMPCVPAAAAPQLQIPPLHRPDCCCSEPPGPPLPLAGWAAAGALATAGRRSGLLGSLGLHLYMQFGYSFGF